MRKALAILLGLMMLGALAFVVLTEPAVYRLLRGESASPRGFGLGALVGATVPLGLVGLFAGVALGIVLVIRRFGDL